MKVKNGTRSNARIQVTNKVQTAKEKCQTDFELSRLKFI